MITLLGKRPFVGRSDEMDKWLDDNKPSQPQPGEKSAPPPIEEAPLPVAMRRDQTEL
jgi:AFG3 family protein